jgi:hypothetical protein
MEGAGMRQEQYGVHDDLADADESLRRDKGRYDPRAVSGAKGAVLVSLRCVHCGKTLGNVTDYEKRPLFYSERTKWWTRSPSGLKCQDCFAPLEGFPVDMDAINAAIEKARHAGRAKVLKIGSKPVSLS